MQRQRREPPPRALERGRVARGAAAAQLLVEELALEAEEQPRVGERVGARRARALDRLGDAAALEQLARGERVAARAVPAGWVGGVGVLLFFSGEVFVWRETTVRRQATRSAARPALKRATWTVRMRLRAFAALRCGGIHEARQHRIHSTPARTP